MRPPNYSQCQPMCGSYMFPRAQGPYAWPFKKDRKIQQRLAFPKLMIRTDWSRRSGVWEADTETLGEKRHTRPRYLSDHTERSEQTGMAQFMGHDVIVSRRGYERLPGTIWGGTRTCSTGDNASMGQHPITTEETQATPCQSELLTSGRDEMGEKKIDRHQEGKSPGEWLHLPICT